VTQGWRSSASRRSASAARAANARTHCAAGYPLTVWARRAKRSSRSSPAARRRGGAWRSSAHSRPGRHLRRRRCRSPARICASSSPPCARAASSPFNRTILPDSCVTLAAQCAVRRHFPDRWRPSAAAAWAPRPAPPHRHVRRLAGSLRRASRVRSFGKLIVLLGEAARVSAPSCQPCADGREHGPGATLPCPSGPHRHRPRGTRRTHQANAAARSFGFESLCAPALAGRLLARCPCW